MKCENCSGNPKCILTQNGYQCPVCEAYFWDKKKIGLTFGVFDILHRGHINLLKNAKDRVDKLIVCLSTAEYCIHVKGKTPIMSFNDRKLILESIIYIDAVDYQSIEFSKADAVKKYKPDYLFVGDDWTPETYKGEGLGVEVIYLPHTKGISSTILRERLK